MLHTNNNPLLDLVLQLRNKIRANCSKILLFITSWCHLFAIFTWWDYWLAKYSLCCWNVSYNILLTRGVLGKDICSFIIWNRTYFICFLLPARVGIPQDLSKTLYSCFQFFVHILSANFWIFSRNWLRPNWCGSQTVAVYSRWGLT